MELVRRLGLTTDQQQRLRGVAREFNEPLAVAGRKARLSRRALDDAILSEQYDETRIKQLADEWAGAQADLMKLQALRRAALRRVLTPEQMLQMNELERQLRREQRTRQGTSGDNPNRPPG
jgi:Spy/CpxP family protein refolding chaperone